MDAPGNGLLEKLIHYYNREDIYSGGYKHNMSLTYDVDFEEMALHTTARGYHIKARRLSTTPFLYNSHNTLATKWVWYWRDDQRWKEYGADEVKLLFIFLLLFA